MMGLLFVSAIGSPADSAEGNGFVVSVVISVAVFKV
jgi:hypothetical protein